MRGDDARRLGLRDDRRRRRRWRRAGRPGSATSSCSAPTAIPGWPRSTGFASPRRRRAMDLSLIYRALARAAGRPHRRRRDQRADRRPTIWPCCRTTGTTFRPTTRSPVARARGAAALPGSARRPSTALAGRITIDDMRRMNHAVDAERQDPARRRPRSSSRGLNPASPSKG